MVRNYYKILGVQPDAGKDEIKKKYRALALKYQPDTNNNSKKAEDQFKIIAEAYETLSNKKKRAEYERQRAYSASSSKTSGGSNHSGFGGYGFGGGQRSGSSRREGPFRADGTPPPAEEFRPDPNAPTSGFDLQFMVDVPLPVMALGGKIPYSYDKYVNCSYCAGSGQDEGKDCSHCKGKKQVVKSVTIEIKIPPGVADQYTIRIEHKGGDGKNGGPPGNLLIKVCAMPHPQFKRVKNDIYADVEISHELAEQGGSLEVETLDSKRTIFVEEGTLTGEEYRIPGQGSALLWGQKRGDFVVRFRVDTP
jgi:molecular chaperone DnaJ